MKNSLVSLLAAGAIGAAAVLCMQTGPGLHGPVCSDHAVVWRYW